MIPRTGSILEAYVQFVYECLLNQRDEGVAVSKNARLRGKSGVFHEVDVYYEFLRAGVRHRVVLECKNLARPVEKADIMEFAERVQDLGGGVNGIVVSLNGYQSGAIKYAAHRDLLLLKAQDLPRMEVLIAGRLRSVLLPDESSVGEPFWAVMQIRNEKATGEYFGTHSPMDGSQRVLLTFSRFFAEQIIDQAQLDRAHWAVRGLQRHSLRGFIIMLALLERQGGGAIIGFKPPGLPAEQGFKMAHVSCDELALEFYGETIEGVPCQL